MSTYGLVHGAWHGGWVWDDLAHTLRLRGHKSLTPTLPSAPGTTLETHVRHVYEAVQAADGPVVLVGHSYAGVVVPQVLALAPDRVESLVLVDGWVTRRGQSLLDVAPEWFAEWCRSTAVGPPHSRVLPPPHPSTLGITDENLVTRLESLLIPQPLATFTDPATRDLPSTTPPLLAIACTPVLTVPFGDMAREAGYAVREITSHHDVMLSKPRELANLLEEIVPPRVLPGQRWR